MTNKRKITNHSVPQSLFRESQLISVSRFVSYCQENGVDTLKEELEQLHREGLLYPAIKVYKGVCKFKKIYAKFGNQLEWRYIAPEDTKKFKPKKIDPKNYYNSGSFSIGTGWIDYYKKNRMIEYPANQKFKPWNKKQYPTFITNYKLIEKDYEFFYDKIQLLSLKFIQREKNVWMHFKNGQRKKLIKSDKQHLAEINRFFETYIVIEELVNRAYNLRHKRLSEYRNDFKDEKEIFYEWKSEFKISFMPSLKQASQNIIKKYLLDLEKINWWIRLLARQNIFHESNRSQKCIRKYLSNISEKDLIDAEDVNFMIFILNQFVFFLTKEQKTVKQIISESNLPTCSICGRSFSPKRVTQKTCADENCIRGNKNESKRIKK